MLKINKHRIHTVYITYIKTYAIDNCRPTTYIQYQSDVMFNSVHADVYNVCRISYTTYRLRDIMLHKLCDYTTYIQY